MARTPHVYLSDGEGGCVHCPLPRSNAIHPARAEVEELLPPVVTWTPPVRGAAAASAPETSHRAAESVSVRSGSVMEMILNAVTAAAGAGRTDDELEQVLGRTHQSVSAGRNRLVAAGLLVAGTVDGASWTRRTRNGNEATVWVLSPAVAVRGAA